MYFALGESVLWEISVELFALYGTQLDVGVCTVVVQGVDVKDNSKKYRQDKKNIFTKP